jgi:hypothetical protein
MKEKNSVDLNSCKDSAAVVEDLYETEQKVVCNNCGTARDATIGICGYCVIPLIHHLK